jgi:outer membrane protein TolC
MDSKIAFLLLLAPLCLSAELYLEKMSLRDAEQIAIEYNKQLLIARESTTQASERRKQAVSKWLPAIHYRGEFREIQTKELFFNVFSDQFTFSHQGYSSILELSQPLFSTDLLFGLKSKTYESTAVQFDQANTKNELLRAVRDHYYAVVSSEISVEINRENVEYLSYALEKEQDRLNAGGSTPFEVNQSKTSVANAISEYYNSLRKLKNARNAFVLTLGIDPLLEPKIELSQSHIPLLSIPELALKLQEVHEKFKYRTDWFSTTCEFTKKIKKIDHARALILFSEEEAKGYLVAALEKRPDLASRKMQVSVADQNLKSKQGTYLPQVAGYARYSYNDINMGTKPFFKEPYNWSCGVVLTWNLFDSMLREHEIREARSQRSASRISYDQEYQRVEVQIRNGLYQVEDALFAYLSSNEGVLIAEQARFQAQEKLEYGRISMLEYRDSVNQLALARNLRNYASFDLIAAYYDLRYATGVDASN